MHYPIADISGTDSANRSAGGNGVPPDLANPARVAPLRPRSMAPEAARTARLVCNARLLDLVRVVCCAEQCNAHLTDRPEEFEQPGLIELIHPRGTIRIALDLAAHPALAIAAWSDAQARSATPAEQALRNAVASVLLEPLLQRLGRLGLDLRVGCLLRGRAARPAATVTPRLPAVALTFTVGGCRYATDITLDAALLPELEALVTSHTEQPRLPMAGGHPDYLVPGRLVLGARRLPVGTLRALTPGDVLLRSLAGLAAFARGATNETNAQARAAWGTPGLVRVHAPVSIDGRTLLILKEPTMTDELDPVRADDSLASDQPDSPIDLSELDLPVQFEVDTVALPLSQLCALRPGYVLELQTSVDDAQLKLVTHGQTIGFGELVSVGEHLGVRILRMAHGDGPVQ